MKHNAISNGVQQGGVLSSTLFNLICNITSLQIYTRTYMPTIFVVRSQEQDVRSCEHGFRKHFRKHRPTLTTSSPSLKFQISGNRIYSPLYANRNNSFRPTIPISGSYRGEETHMHISHELAETGTSIFHQCC